MAFLEEAARLERLSDELEFLGLHGHLRPGATVDAPVLEQWRLGIRPVRCLVGLATGHPVLRGHRVHARDESYCSRSGNVTRQPTRFSKNRPDQSNQRADWHSEICCVADSGACDE